VVALYRRGDVVSLSRSQTSRVTVAGSSDALQQVTLNGRPYSYQPAGVETAEALAEGLARALADQTVVNVERLDAHLMFIGDLGRSFTLTVGSNLAVELLMGAVQGRTSELYRVQSAREFWTRDPESREIISKTIAVARVVGGGQIAHLFDDEIQTLVEAA